MSQAQALAYVRPGEDAPGADEQLGLVYAKARELRLPLVGVARDSKLEVKVGAMSHSIAGLVALLDRTRVEAVLLVWDVGRLRPPGWSGRPIDEILRERGFEIVETKGAQVIVAAPPPTRSPKRARLTEAQVAAIAARLSNGRRRGALAGRHQSGPSPYGYDRDAEKILVVRESEAEIVRLVFKTYLQPHASIKKVQAALEARRSRTRRGKHWSRAGIAWILQNNTYVGRVHFGDVQTKGRHEPLVSSIEFNKTQQKLHEQNKRRGKATPIDPVAVPQG